MNDTDVKLQKLDERVNQIEHVVIKNHEHIVIKHHEQIDMLIDSVDRIINIIKKLEKRTHNLN